MPCPGRSRQEGWRKGADAHLGPMRWGGGGGWCWAEQDGELFNNTKGGTGGGGRGREITMPAAGSLGAPTCSLRGSLKEQEVKEFLHREEAELAGGGGG